MKIIEARDGFINFEADKSVYLSSFIQAKGENKSYIAQVCQLKQIGDVCIAAAKILFLFTDGELLNYDKTLPSRDAEISLFPSSILHNSADVNNPIIITKLLNNTDSVIVDSDAFNKKMLISVDSQKLNNLIINNLTKQFNNLDINTIVIDTNGVISDDKFVAGVDFKLPLNTETLKFMYNSCLNDATSESKSTINEIFNDLSEYSKTVPFVPFEALKTIVDDMVDNQHIFKLFVLKNRLAKLEKLGYFATKKSETDKLQDILSSKHATLDLSKLDSLFQNYFLEFIYNNLTDKNVQVFFETSASVSKKNLKHIIIDSNVHTTLITNSKYQYLNDIKSTFDNFIIEPTISNKEVFKVYNSFFDSMSDNMYLTVGEAVNYIPIVSEARVINDVISINATNTEEQIQEIIPSDTDNNENVADIESDSTEEIQLGNDEKKDDIIAAIDEKSDNVINSVAESLDEDFQSQNIDLFTEDSSEYIEMNQEDAKDSEEQEDNIGDTSEISEESENPKDNLDINNEEIIEPEYRVEESEEDFSNSDTLDDDSNIEETFEEEVVEGTIENTEPNTDISVQEEAMPEFNENEQLEEILETDVDSFNDLSDDLTSELSIDDTLDLSEADLTEYNDIDESDLNVNEDINTEINELSVESENNQQEFIQELESSDIEKNDISISEKAFDTYEEPQVINLNEDDGSFDEIVELDPDSADENDIIIDISDESDNINIDEELDKQIVADVDKVYTTMKETDELEEISDSDLDFIDELNNDNEIQLEEFNDDLSELPDSSGIEEGILEQPQESIIPEKQPIEYNNTEILEKREANTPIVPVYDADIPQEDMVVSDPIQQGDSVIHAKYGNGVVEKMIKYGNKTLYSINFENIGRRLLDPTLTEIKKL